MKIDDEEWKDINGINNITGILSEYIERTPSLLLKEKLNLLMDEVKRNIENGILSSCLGHAIILDPSTVEKKRINARRNEELYGKSLNIRTLRKEQ